MMTLASKYKVTNTFKNEAIEVFYSAKTNLTDILVSLRNFVSEKAKSLNV